MNNDYSLISILMPTYNVEEYVEEAVRSVLNQTYSCFELIIVDDCSTDNTFKILKKLEAEDKRIKLYRNDVNSKICKSLNKALQYAKGSYIGRMDGDDISEPQRFELLKQYLDNHPNIALVGSNLITIDERGLELSRKKALHSSKTIIMGNRIISSVPHVWLARYEIYESLKGYREVPFVEDYDFLLRGELMGYKYANIDHYVYRCRLRSGNTGSSNGLKQRKAVEYIQQLHKTEERLKQDCFFYRDYCKAIEITNEENERYCKGYNSINKAIRMKKKPIKMISYTLLGMMQDGYVAKYIIDAFRYRCLSIIDRFMKE